MAELIESNLAPVTLLALYVLLTHTLTTHRITQPAIHRPCRVADASCRETTKSSVQTFYCKDTNIYLLVYLIDTIKSILFFLFLPLCLKYTYVYKHKDHLENAEGPCSSVAYTTHTEHPRGCFCSHHTHHH